MGGHAVTLIQKLSSCFLEYAKEGYDDDNHAMAAGQCLEAIVTVLDGVNTVCTCCCLLCTHYMLHTVSVCCSLVAAAITAQHLS
jgi:hypothetical protein